MAYVAFAMNVDEPPFFVESFNVPASVFLEFHTWRCLQTAEIIRIATNITSWWHLPRPCDPIRVVPPSMKWSAKKGEKKGGYLTQQNSDKKNYPGIFFGGVGEKKLPCPKSMFFSLFTMFFWNWLYVLRVEFAGYLPFFVAFAPIPFFPIPLRRSPPAHCRPNRRIRRAVVATGRKSLEAEFQLQGGVRKRPGS